VFPFFPGYPERMPFADFCRAFRRLLQPPNDQRQQQQPMGEEGDSREEAKQILLAAKVPEHRFRLGLSQILLQK
jgi:myosin heavy subunit